MSEEFDVLKIVSQRLEKSGIPHRITGSAAANFYAVPRMTRNIDIVIEIHRRDTDRILSIFKDDFYIDQETVKEAVETEGIFNILHHEYVLKVDFIVRKHSPYRELEFKRRRKVEADWSHPVDYQPRGFGSIEALVGPRKFFGNLAGGRQKSFDSR